MLWGKKYSDEKHLRAAAYQRERYRRLGRPTWEEYNRIRAEKKRIGLEKRAAERAARIADSEAKRPASMKRQYEKNRQWRLANAERYRELLRNWKKRNRDKVRARKKASGKRLRSHLWARQAGKCAICGTRLGNAVHVDHIMPIALGGTNARSNLQLTHPACNMAKKAKHPIDHARTLGRLL